MKAHLFILALAVICFAACRKADPAKQTGSTTVTSLTGIKVYGSWFAECQLCFSAIGSGAKTYKWSVGDGTTSTAATFCYTYAHPCIDTIKLTINDDPTFSTSQVVYIYKASTSITAMLAGNRTWRFYEGHIFPNGSSTVAFKNLVDLEVVYIDPATLRIGNDTMRLQTGFDSTLYSYVKQINSEKFNDSWILRLHRYPKGDSITYSILHSATNGLPKQT